MVLESLHLFSGYIFHYQDLDLQSEIFHIKCLDESCSIVLNGFGGTMSIGGGPFVSVEMVQNENLIADSMSDVEEVSSYVSALNPLNLYGLGAVFFLGRLVLTDQRLILLPYHKVEVEKAKHFETVAYHLVKKLLINIPMPEILFYTLPVIIPLEDVRFVNPYKKQSGIHYSLRVYTDDEKYIFKFANPDNPFEWAQLIEEYSSARVTDLDMNQCIHCNKVALPEKEDICHACHKDQAPGAADIMKGELGLPTNEDILKIDGWKNKLRAFISQTGHNQSCPICEYLNHKAAVICKYCRCPL